MQPGEGVEGAVNDEAVEAVEAVEAAEGPGWSVEDVRFAGERSAGVTVRPPPAEP